MEKEVGTASELVRLEASGGFQGFKESVFNALGNFFSWLSTHQGLGLIIIIVVLAIIVWLLMRIRKYRIQVKNEIYLKKKEIGKKEELIKEQENKLTTLQKKLSDQQAVASGAMLKTLSTLTGYDADQLPIFFKSLSQIRENPLQLADPKAVTDTDSQRIEGESDGPALINETTEKLDSGEDLADKDDSKEVIASGDDSSTENDTKEKLASGGDTAEEDDTAKNSVADDDSSKKDATEETASEDDLTKEDDAIKDEAASEAGSKEAEETKKSGE